MLTVLPDNLLLNEVGRGWSLKDAVVLGRVNRDLHTRTFLTVKGLYVDRIKRFWERCQKCWSTVLLVERFKALRLDEESIVSVDFMAFAQYLKTKLVVRASKRLVERLNYLVIHTLRNRGAMLVGTPSKASVRVFLAAFMIRYRQDDCMAGTTSDVEVEVIQAAGALVACFEGICVHLLDAAPGLTFAQIMPHALVEDFPALMVRFYAAFDAWKAPAAASLAERLAQTLATLEDGLAGDDGQDADEEQEDDEEQDDDGEDQEDEDDGEDQDEDQEDEDGEDHDDDSDDFSGNDDDALPY